MTTEPRPTSAPSRSVPRRTRRALVLTMYLGYLAMTLAWAFLDAPLRWLLVIPLGLAALISLATLMMPRLLGTSDGADDDLDERQLQTRNKAYLAAYRVLGVSVMLAALYYMMARGSGLWLPTTDLETQALFWGAWGFSLTLPSAMLAWNEPDADEA